MKLIKCNPLAYSPRSAEIYSIKQVGKSAYTIECYFPKDADFPAERLLWRSQTFKSRRSAWAKIHSELNFASSFRRLAVAS